MINNKVESIKEHLMEIMKILEIEPTESNKNTSLRIAKMWVNEVFANVNDYNIKELKDTMTVFPKEGDTDLVVVKDIPFCSTCEHHFMPFFGTVSVGYVPRDSIIGLSKIPRIVKYFSKRPQLQERYTTDIGEFLVKTLNPLAVFIEVEAEHTCVKCRGAESDCKTHTSYKWWDENYVLIDEFGTAIYLDFPQYYEEFKERIRCY